MKMISLSPSKLKPYEKNPRNNNKAVDSVVRSIQQFGFLSPIVVDEGMVILAGHTRCKAAIKLGLESVQVCVISGLSGAKKKAYRIADNRTHEDSSWDRGLLASELDSLKMEQFDLHFLGFTESQLTTIMGEGTDEELFGDVPGDGIKGIAQKGHELLCPKCGCRIEVPNE